MLAEEMHPEHRMERGGRFTSMVVQNPDCLSIRGSCQRWQRQRQQGVLEAPAPCGAENKGPGVHHVPSPLTDPLHN